MTGTYKLGPRFFEKLRRRMIIVGLPLVLIALGGGALFAAARQGSSSTALIIAPVILLVLIFGFRSTLKQVQKNWGSYRLEVEPDALSRTQDNYAPLRIARDEISRVVEYSGGSLVVHAASPKREIIIPNTLEGYEEVKALLGQWHAIEREDNRSPQNTLLLFGTVILTMAAFGVVLLGQDRTLVLVVGTLFLLALVGCLVYIQRSSAIDRKAKRNAWWVLLPILMTAARLVLLIAD